MLLNNLRVATQQQTAPQSAEMIFNDATMWEGTGTYDLQASPGLQLDTDGLPAMFRIGLTLCTRCRPSVFKR